MNEQTYPWYMVNKYGMCTLCSDQADAEQEAKNAQEAWPHIGPHRAVRLVEVGDAGFTAADMATASAQGFRDGVASVAASAGSEPVAWQYRSVRNKGMWFDCTEERAKQRAAHPETWEVRYLYTHPSPPEGMVGGWIASKDQMPPPGVRVFWGDVDSHRVGYDSWAGDDYRWAPSHWMHIPEFPAPPTTSAGSGKGE